MLEIGQRHMGQNPGIVDGDDVLGGPVLGVAGHLVRPDLPPKADAPEEIAHRLALHDVGRGDEGGEADAALPAADDVVVVVAEPDGAPIPHGRSVRIGRADADVTGASISPA